MKYRFERTYGTIEVGNISSRAAEVAFYLLLSLFPFLLFTISAVVFIPIIYLNRYINIKIQKLEKKLKTMGNKIILFYNKHKPKVRRKKKNEIKKSA